MPFEFQTIYLVRCLSFIAPTALRRRLESQFHPAFYHDTQRALEKSRYARSSRPLWDSRWKFSHTGNPSNGVFPGLLNQLYGTASSLHPITALREGLEFLTHPWNQSAAIPDEFSLVGLFYRGYGMAVNSFEDQVRNVPWTDDHLLIALNLYAKIPFGKFSQTNPAIIDVARKMGRTSSSLSMKLCNLASLDPLLHATGRVGLQGASKRDRIIWDIFHEKPDEFGPQSEYLLHDLFGADEMEEIEIAGGNQVIRKFVSEPPMSAPVGSSEFEKIVQMRRGQSFFRGAVLAAYGGSCCITGIAEGRLLEASHIKPWAEAPSHRHDPQNGLCLSVLHHAAFDAGLITFDDSLRLILSSKLRAHLPQPAIEQNFVCYAGVPIRRAIQNAAPNPNFLAFHRENRFVV